jgi:hypothetical protein
MLAEFDTVNGAAVIAWVSELSGNGMGIPKLLGFVRNVLVNPFGK